MNDKSLLFSFEDNVKTEPSTDGIAVIEQPTFWQLLKMWNFEHLYQRLVGKKSIQIFYEHINY